MARHVLAIDMGSGSVKAAVVSDGAEVVGCAMREIATRQLPGGGAEQDPHEWWSAVTAAGREAVEHAGVPAESVLAVKCATQWAVTVPVDADGEVLHPAISWMDSRGGRHVRALAGGPVRVSGYDVRKLRRWLRLTGGAPVLSGVDGFGHVLFLKHERPEVYAAAHKLLEPMDYLSMRLTGRFAASQATIFPYWLTDNRDPERIDYDPGLLRLAGIEREKLPDLLAVDAVQGTLRAEAAGELGLRPETKVLVGSNDAHAATIGAGSIENGDGYFYVGTTAWMSCHVPRKKTDIVHMLATMPAALPGRYMVVAEQGMAGRCLEWLRDSVLWPAGEVPDDAYERMNHEAATVPAGSDGLIFTPWINGVLVPSEDPWTRSAFFNQSWRTTRGHYVRAVMEGVAYNLRWLRHHEERFVGQRFERLTFTGGAAQSDLWCQTSADVLGVPVHRVAEPRFAIAVGAALSAFMALGVVRPDAVPALVRPESAFEPDPVAAAVHDRQFEQFLALFKRGRRIYRALNAPG